MAFLRMDFASGALEMNTSVQIVLPEEGALSEKKVVLLLHGLSDNCTGWSRMTSCELTARQHDAVLIMPEVQRSFYTDGVYGLRYFTYVAEELPQVMHRTFGLSTEKAQNYVMGLSMGGYGAVKCALTHPERYAGCGSFSGVLDFPMMFRKHPDLLKKGETVALLGPDLKVSEENDLEALLQKAENIPPVYLSCGEQDLLFPMTQHFAQLLEQKGVSHRFDHRPGDHTWDFWDQSLRDCLNWLLKE